ncbi:MAG TPA: ABC transporter permease [Anaerolineales bacterium]|nr:ABC transporter permease [Anaerolineales bacterium]
MDRPRSEVSVWIRPSRGWGFADLKELWRYRELIYFLIWRDVKVRYKQTLLGAAWAILKPFLSMVVFTVIFAGLAQLETDGIAPPVFYFSGLLPWVLFQDGVTKAGNSLVASSNLITKVYFPRMSIPLALVVSGLVDFALSFVVLLGMVAFYGIRLTSAAWLIPVFLGLALIASLGVGFWLAALNVSYRDVGYVTPFLVQAWMYASPVVYPATLIPEGFSRIVYGLNPMAGVVQGFRWAIVGAGAPSAGMLFASLGMGLVLLISGIFVFRRMERHFADIV